MNLTLEQWAVALTAIVAVAGFGLSLHNWWQGRPRRRVEASLGLIPHSILAESIRGIIVKFINERGPVVVIEEVGFECADGRHAVKSRVGSDKLPTTVPAGHSAKYYAHLDRWREAVQGGDPMPIRAYCRDATGHRYETPLTRETRSALLGREGSGSGGGGEARLGRRTRKG